MPTDPLVRLFFGSGERATIRAFDKGKAMMQSALADAPKSPRPWRTHEQVIYKKYDIKFTA